MAASPHSIPAITSRLRAVGCVFAEDEARLLAEAAHSPEHLSALVDRRVTGLPLEQILGWAQFHDLRIAVEPDVFVPRRRTELLVRQATELARPGAVVLDLCCGTGAVGAALATIVDRAEVHAADLDPAAVRCARRNLAAAGGRVYEGDLYEPVPARLRGNVDLLVVNAPYVPTDAVDLMPPEARLHEPRAALDGGADGLSVQRRVVAEARNWLAPRGHLLIETSEPQAPRLAGACADAGLVTRIVGSAELDATVVLGSAGLVPDPAITMTA
ncbi:putative protein N(5)-glutamine methyltransferase [Amycolatopsis cihanbeyliensis]|uniref:peptide chain release factor N(5)-glutamine methyltransferase n=1 Tax=Amycolatopsis cihanbeyliensis TaxID=1128664 RepID=A0A542DC74_AMYCI|nr:putative protein N(5)-glutamine methyltransferase [Amycolatopsis cihanbeyliensis]TQJ00655.1 release factor glutamine methyltransferase [Amycolatopsis cihanbeyliensis]